MEERALHQALGAREGQLRAAPRQLVHHHAARGAVAQRAGQVVAARVPAHLRTVVTCSERGGGGRCGGGGETLTCVTGRKCVRASRTPRAQSAGGTASHVTQARVRSSTATDRVQRYSTCRSHTTDIIISIVFGTFMVLKLEQLDVSTKGFLRVSG